MSDIATPSRFFLVHAGECKKLGPRSTGRIRYQVLADEARQQLWLRLVGNDSSGCFSSEPVPMTAIETCVQSVQPDRPLPSKALAACYRGRSSNNGPFAVAALRDLGLLVPVPENLCLSRVEGDWQAWKETMLAATGTEITIAPKEKSLPGKAPQAAPAETAPEHREPPKPKDKPRKGGKPVPVTETNHAGDPAGQ